MHSSHRSTPLRFIALHAAGRFGPAVLSVAVAQPQDALVGADQVQVAVAWFAAIGSFAAPVIEIIVDKGGGHLCSSASDQACRA